MLVILAAADLITLLAAIPGRVLGWSRAVFSNEGIRLISALDFSTALLKTSGDVTCGIRSSTSPGE